MPSLTATGSAPQMPIRQPDSIVIPLDSAISSSDRPSLAATVLSSGTKWTSGAPLLSARFLAIEADATAPAAPAIGAAAWAWNGFSLRQVRWSQTAASAIAAARSGHVAGSSWPATYQ